MSPTRCAEVASQVGNLIWEARGGSETVTIRRDTAAAVIPLVEETVTARGSDPVRSAALHAALADLYAALHAALADLYAALPGPGKKAPSEGATETRTETRRDSD
jgi:hypothetical protein